MSVFRFVAAMLLIVAVSLAGIVLEKRELSTKRAISLQHFRMDLLREEHARLRSRLHHIAGAQDFPLKAADMHPVP